MNDTGGDFNEMSKNHANDAGFVAMITGSPDPDHPLGHMLNDLEESAMGWPSTVQVSISQQRFTRLVSTYQPRWLPRQQRLRDAAYQGDAQCSAFSQPA